METKLTIDEKFDLITRGLVNEEPNTLLNVESIDEMKKLLALRRLKIYWGTATTGSPSFAYLVPLCKIKDFLLAGCEVTILLADLHAYLDSSKTPLHLLDVRAQYYEEVILSILTSLNAPLENLKFIRGKSFQLQPKYTLDMLTLTTKVSDKKALKAGAEVVKSSACAPISAQLYPIYQCLDEEYVTEGGVDIQFGGLDQRKIFVLAKELLPLLGYKKRIHLMNEMIPSLAGERGNKMSSSEINNKIDFTDSPDTVAQKIKKSFAEAKIISGNSILSIVKNILFPLFCQFTDKPYIVERDEKHGKDVTFASYEAIERAYADGSLFPADLKTSVVFYINQYLAKLQPLLQAESLQQLYKLAYQPNIQEK
jgi:tyrosyl-tRNA synthetase